MTYRLERMAIPAVFGLAMSLPCMAAAPIAETGGAPASVTLFQNVRVFDGKSDRLIGPRNVLVRGKLIERISGEPISIDPGAAATVIDGGGRTLMPGLIDAHAHLTQSTVPLPVMLTADPNYWMLIAGKAAGEFLMRGFTSARDVGGPVFGLKRAIDEGVLPGPRIWPHPLDVSFRQAIQASPGGDQVQRIWSQR
ncbi:MAG: amidohydrolase family protein [Gammaproteobacteria bacterium]